MKFIIDAQLPRRFAVWLVAAGHDARHTLDLPNGNRTSDRDIVTFAERERRIVVSKDEDFVQSFLLTGQPSLLLISTGNISNAELEQLIHANWERIELAFTAHHFIEITRTALIIHD